MKNAFEVYSHVTQIATRYVLKVLAEQGLRPKNQATKRTNLCVYGDFWFVEIKSFDIVRKATNTKEVKINRHSWEVQTNY